VEGSKVLREYPITQVKIQTGGGRGKKEIADYVWLDWDVIDGMNHPSRNLSLAPPSAGYTPR
jgi:hypothetical protein